MKGLEPGKDKIQKICDLLRKETLEPAKQEASEIVENAHMQAAQIIAEAKEKARIISEEEAHSLEEKRKVFDASLNLACRQGIELLKQRIEKEIFNTELSQLVNKEMSDPQIVANILNSFMQMMEKKGVEEDFIAVIPKDISPRTINQLMAARMLEKLENKSVEVGGFLGGAQIKLKGKQITIDASDTVVRELIAQYIRRDFRDLLFNV